MIPFMYTSLRYPCFTRGCCLWYSLFSHYALFCPQRPNVNRQTKIANFSEKPNTSRSGGGEIKCLGIDRKY